jgi:streptogramin lyase
MLWFLLVACCGMGIAEAAASADGSGSGGFPIEVRSRPSQARTASPTSTGAEEGEVAPANAEEPPSATLSLSGGPLVGSGSPTEGEELQAEHQAKLVDPEAVEARRASRTKFANLTAAQAGSVAGGAFPELMDDPAGGAPKLPAGQAVESYLTNYAAQISGPEGGREVLESTLPMATESSSGQHTPIDLGLSALDGRFVPRSPLVAVQIPKLLGEGVQFPGLSLSITPVDSQGAALGGSNGASDGTSVLYANTQTDADTVVKPTSAGVDSLTVLRSVMSPQHLYFAVGLPAGAALVQTEESGPVHVVVAGKTIATIQRPAAQDSAGTTVPVVMSVSGSTVALEVEDQSAEYLYPIAVDPEVTGEDKQVVETTGGKRSNWKFETTSEANFGHEPHEGPHKDEGTGKGYLETFGASEYKETETAFWAYETKGVSKIYEVNAKTEGKNKGAEVESFLELEHSGTSEDKYKLSSETYEPEYASVEAPPLCAKNGTKVECAPAAGTAGNAVRFQQSVQKKPTNDHFVDRLLEAIVYLSEPAGTHSTTKFNTTSPEVEGEVVNEKGEKAKQKRPNALYGSGGWLSNYQDAIEPIAEDSGIGVAATKLEYESAPSKWEKLAEHNYLETENGCEGVQCFVKHGEYWTVASRLPQGEDKIRYRAEEAMRETESTEAEGQATVKVDTQPPHNIHLRGLPFGEELTERPYKLTAEATDGEGTTVASSGIKSLALYVDGKEYGTPSGSCSVPKGECSASAEWTINGAELGAGHHSIQVIAFDNAGNEGRLSGGGTEISIRHSTPVPLGPGSVDLESGDFALAATDVSMGSGLTVSRTYSSRDLSQGDDGPLGPQWSMSLGTSESLTELVDGSLLLTAANGNQTIFAKPAAGVKCEPAAPFESPQGDSNLKLWCEENTETKTRDAYYLENTTAHTKDKFTQSGEGTTEWVPTRQEGAVATDTVSYAYQTVPEHNEYSVPSGSQPYSITSGSDGNLWFTNTGTSKIGKITPAGKITEYALPSESVPYHIVAGPDGNLWFTEKTTSKIGKITTTGKITEYALPTGSGPTGITVGPDNNLWFADNGSGKVGKITTSGAITEYALPTGDTVPDELTAGPNNSVWLTEFGDAALTEVSVTTGAITEVLPSATSGGGITTGPEGDLWRTNVGTSKIIKITAAGESTEYSLPTGSDPWGITAGPDGNLWFTDEGTNKVGRITPTGTVTEFAEPSGSELTGITAGPDNNLWFTEAGGNQIDMITPAGVITEPREALAAVPSGVSCSWKEKPTEMQAGCRAVEFHYDTGATTAKGESESEWGEYAHRLSKVLMVAYNPATKKMEETPVAEYAWDSRGYLRAEWDPRIAPALKTTDGYDPLGHLTALDPPGAEPWALTYGTSRSDAGAGRVLKVTRPLATAALWSGETVQNTELPAITGNPVAGSRLAVSNGKWSGNPNSYGYAWEECENEAGCKLIPGADNANYTPTETPNGETSLIAIVTATNGGGSVTAESPAVRALGVTRVTAKESLNAISCVPETTTCVVSDNEGGAFYTSNMSINGTPSWQTWTRPSGGILSRAIDCPSSSLCLLADGYSGDLYYATALGGSWSEAMGPLYAVNTISCASSTFCVAGENGDGYYKYSLNPGSREWNQEQQEAAPLKGVDCLSTAFCAMVDSSGSVHVATTTAQIESSAWTITSVDRFANGLSGIACSTTTSCVAVDESGNAMKLAISGTGSATASTQEIDTGHHLTGVTCVGKTTCVTVDNAGNVFISRNQGETWLREFQLGLDLTSVSCPSVSLCVTANTKDQVTAFDPAVNEGEAANPGPGWTIDYEVPISGSSAPHQMSRAEVAKWGQIDDPVEATAITPPDSPQGWPAASYKRSTVDYLDESGDLVNQATPTAEAVGAITTTEYNEYNDIAKTLSAENRATALTAGCVSEKSCASAEFAELLSAVSTYNEPECRRESDIKEKEAAEPGTRLCETWGPTHEIKYTPNGFKGQKESGARDHTEYFYEDAANGAPAGEKYDLVTETANLAQLFNNEGKPEEEVEIRKATTAYSGQAGLGWTLRAPTSQTSATETGGAKITNTTIYYETGEAKGQIKETRGPEGAAGGTAHDSRIVYYTAEENKEGFSGCGKHPEWAGLTCETLPAKQPAEVSGLPSLPDTTTTYNMWYEPIKVEEVFPKTATFPETKRTKTEEYDPAGRLHTSETTSTSTKVTALPKVTDAYNTATGLLETQSTEEVSKKPVTITTKDNRLGQLESYTDSDGNTAKYVHGGPDSLLEEMSDSSGANSAGEHRSTQKYKYDETTKAMTSIVDSAAGTFTATYGLEGKIASEIYPNGMCANYTRNSVGEDIHIEYIKTTNCAEKGAAIWFSESRVPSIRGEIMSRTTTLASYAYLHNTVGQLIEAQETPAGSYCKVRAYTYNEEADRKSEVTREPNTKHECATEGGTEEKHIYNEANTLADSGIEYEALGDVTKLPAADAEGHELKSTFYVDGAVATQEQNSIENTYRLDPNGRDLEVTTGTKAVISHYDGPGEAVAWRCELSATTKECEEKRYVRNIPGFGGSLSAVQTNGATPVLQLHDLEGDVVATAADNTTETKVLSTYNSTEFGVPNAGKAPPPFAWLGAADIESALPTGVITYGATSYVPQIGLALQAGEVEPPGAATGSGVGTPYTCQLEPWVTAGATREANEAPGIGAAEEHEALMRAWEAALAADPPEIIHYREWEAKQKIKAINQAEAWGNLAEGASSIFGTVADYLKGYAEGLFTTEIGWTWIQQYGEFLENCLSKLHESHDSHGGCRAEFHVVEFGGTFANFFDKPLISECTSGKSNGDDIDNLELSYCTLLGYEGEGLVLA